jgi:hypothetical protein
VGEEPDYYRTLGVEPTADAAAIEAAFRRRVLHVRLSLLHAPPDWDPGPSREEIESAFAVLGDPAQRARYDRARFPQRTHGRGRRAPSWRAWAFLAVALAAIVVNLGVGLRRGWYGFGGGTGARPGAARPVSEVLGLAGSPPPTTAATVPAPAPTATPPAPTPARVPSVQVEASRSDPTATPPTPAPSPAAAPPTATAAPTPSPAPAGTPEPTATPAFRATDQVGPDLGVPVNLRAGPGVQYPTQGLLTPGTPLAATGESTMVAGVVWRRFTLADGRTGWVRDVDVVPAARRVGP